MKCQGFSHDCESMEAENFRMHTAFIDDELNRRIMCPDCQQESKEYWDESWAQYYAGCL